MYNTFKTNKEGFFEFEVPIKTQLFIEVKHENYNLRYKKIVYFDVKKSDFFKIYLIPLSKNIEYIENKKLTKYAEINLNNIPIKSRKGKLILDVPELFFRVNEDELIEGGNRKTLDEVIEILINNPNLVIEISSHTDSRGPKKYLINLSKRRAENVRIFFEKRGIERNRIKVKGNGSMDLLNDCKEGKKCTEEQYKKNKRTEFVVLNPIKKQ